MERMKDNRNIGYVSRITNNGATPQCRVYQLADPHSIGFKYYKQIIWSKFKFIN